MRRPTVAERPDGSELQAVIRAVATRYGIGLEHSDLEAVARQAAPASRAGTVLSRVTAERPLRTSDPRPRR